MCLATAYGKEGNEGSVIAKSVVKIDLEGDNIYLTDIMGNKIKVAGTLLSIDMMENSVTIDVA